MKFYLFPRAQIPILCVQEQDEGHILNPWVILILKCIICLSTAGVTRVRRFSDTRADRQNLQFIYLEEVALNSRKTLQDASKNISFASKYFFAGNQVVGREMS